MRRAAFGAFVVLAAACATIGSPGEGDVDLPTSGVGPFRKLDGDETLGVAPYVLDDKLRKWSDPAVIPQDPSAPDARVILFVAGTVPTPDGDREAIARTRADDGRSFYGNDVGHTPLVVMTAQSADERVRAPSAAWLGGRLFLYWADADGIRVATSDDAGHTFAPRPARALERDAQVAWEAGPPGAPTVAALPDGRIRMMYAAGGYIGEAESDDGFTFARLDADPSTQAIDPVFGPSVAPDPSTLAPGEKAPFDDARVDDPCLLPRVTPAGRLHVRVLYTGTDAFGVTSIGFAARYGDKGPLVRQAQPVYAVGKAERAPALYDFPSGALLYVGQDRVPSADVHYSAIAAAFAPANRRLPPATAYPDSP